jgi:hypothetical protein
MDRWSRIVLLILIAIGAGILFTSYQQPDSHNAAPVSEASKTLPEIISGTPSSLYRSDAFGFTIMYPSSITVQTSGFDGYLSVTHTPLAGFALPASLFEGTNLTEAGVYIGASTDPAIVAVCTQPSSDAHENTIGDMVVDGASFKVTTSTDVGAGNLYEMTSYRTVHNNACIEVVELLHSTNSTNYSPGTVQEFDHQKFSGILDALVQTFTLI